MSLLYGTFSSVLQTHRSTKVRGSKLMRPASDKNGWKWIDGTSVSYLNWAAGERNNGVGNEECFHVRLFCRCCRCGVLLTQSC